MGAVKLSQLRSSILSKLFQDADQQDSSFTPALVLDAINEAKNSLVSILFSVEENYFTDTDMPLTLVSGTSEYTLPVGFLTVQSIRCTTSGREHVIFEASSISDEDFTEGQRTDLTIENPSRYRFALVGERTIIFSPIPRESAALTVMGEVNLSDYSAEADTLDINDAWKWYIINKALAILSMSLPDGSHNKWAAAAAESERRVKTEARVRQKNTAYYSKGFMQDYG